MSPRGPDSFDGLLPAATSAAQTAGERQMQYALDHPADSYTDRPHIKRCISYGAPAIFAGYNSCF